MKIFLLGIILHIIVIDVFCQVRVSGYQRSNGTHVQSHMRSSPDKNPYNNYSYPGNTNPYTGKAATGNPETYLRNYGSSNQYYSEAMRSEYNQSTPVNVIPKKHIPDRFDALRAGEILIVEDHTALRENPDPNSRVITHVVGDFTFIRSTDQYVQVESAGNKGYINKMFIKSKDAAVGEKATELAVATKLKNYAKYVDSLGQVVKVFLYSPVTVKPTSSSRIVVYADNRKVLLLSDFNNEYCVVRIGKIRGYMNKSYLYYY